MINIEDLKSRQVIDKNMKSKLIKPEVHVGFITKAISDEDGNIVRTEDSYYITGPIYLTKLVGEWLYFYLNEVHTSGSEFKMICDSEYDAYKMKAELELVVANYNCKLFERRFENKFVFESYDNVLSVLGEPVTPKLIATIRKRGKRK